MSMTMPELQRALQALRLSGMIATLEARAMQVQSHQMNFLEAFSCLVQDELDRCHSRPLDRRFSLAGLPERKDLKDFDWAYNPKVPKRDVLGLSTLKFIEAKEGALLIDDLFLRRLPPNAGRRARRRADESQREVLGRHHSSNRTVDGWGKPLGDVVVVAPLLDRIMHHGRLLKCKSYRLEEAAEKVAKCAVSA